MGLNHYVAWVKSEFGIGIEDRVSQNSNISFDLSVLEIYGCLCNGGTLVPARTKTDCRWPAEMIQRERLTVWISVPSSISLMMSARQVSPDYLGSVRLFAHCGEALLPDHLRAIFTARPDAVVYNLYGPTEATVSMTANRLTAENYEAECGASVALGPAIPGMEIELVGGTMDEGEIVILGPQVALGYFEDEIRTARAFQSDHSQRYGYFTGDWAERRDGRLFFRQRHDRQIKIRGYRIELDEVEAAIRGLGWTICCAFKWHDTIAAVVETRGIKADAKSIRCQLKILLDEYKIPAFVEQIDAMPYSENGKLDVAATEKW